MTADELTGTLMQTAGWSSEAVALGIRAGFKCEYCDLDLLSSVETYKSASRPYCTPYEGARPRQPGEPGSRLPKHATLPEEQMYPSKDARSSATRQELISEVRDYVRRCRTDYLKEVARIRTLVLEYETKFTPGDGRLVPA